MFECGGHATGVSAGLGVALLSARHLRSDMEVIEGRLPTPPGLSYVVRRSRRAHNPALETLISEIKAEIGRKGGLALAG